MCRQVRAYVFNCGCYIYNFGQVLGIKYDQCKNYDIYTNTLHYCDPTAHDTCLEEGNEYLPNLSCWAHNKLRRQGKDLALMKPLVYESPCEFANSGDFVNDDAFKRTRDHIYVQSDVKIMLELYGEAFRGRDPKGEWDLVERELAGVVEQTRVFRSRGAAWPVVVAPRILRPAVLEYLD